jgi:hypothetical protein
MKNEIKKDVSLIRESYKDHVVIQKQIDLRGAFERKNKMHLKFIEQPVNDECSIGAYLLCRDICYPPQCSLDEKLSALLDMITGEPSKIQYDGWRLHETYGISAYPADGINLLTKDDKDTFVSPGGKRYPSWSYHMAALFLLEKEGKITYLVADPLLFAEPLTLNGWLQSFGGNTVYRIQQFKINSYWDKQIHNRAKIPSSAYSLNAPARYVFF